ncbi:hypothetical protein QYF61_003182 [Mycteria americana]|uniref:Uncharacterized protein n=1 Tax=Mycteria americana TaxID=33587 RepID=A0AAN7S0B7_MYCAM|nr:hypothetical protein QYF61_003182 [Mycteria americana]
MAEGFVSCGITTFNNFSYHSCVKKAFRTMINHAWIAQKQEGGIVEEWLSDKGHDLIDVSNPAFDGAWEPEITG